FLSQAEDGIRDRNVTGVQTCALPISPLQPLDALVPWRSTPESEREQPGGQQTGEAHGRTEEEPIDRGEAERHSDRDTGDAVEQPLEQARGHRATATVE